MILSLFFCVLFLGVKYLRCLCVSTSRFLRDLQLRQRKQYSCDLHHMNARREVILTNKISTPTHELQRKGAIVEKEAVQLWKVSTSVLKRGQHTGGVCVPGDTLL